jgi:hypothetical protein
LTVVAGLLLIAAGVVASLTVGPFCSPPPPPGMVGDQTCYTTLLPAALGVIGGVGGAALVVWALVPRRTRLGLGRRPET